MLKTTSSAIQYIETHTYDEIKIGDSVTIKYTLTDRDIDVFTAMTKNMNPQHLDPEYANNELFQEIISHGMWGVALISAVLGTELPGPGTVYLVQTFKFLHPIKIGDTISVSVTVKNKKPKYHVVEFNCQCINQSGKTVINGTATVMAPTKKIKRKRIESPKIISKENI